MAEDLLAFGHGRMAGWASRPKRQRPRAKLRAFEVGFSNRRNTPSDSAFSSSTTRIVLFIEERKKIHG
jgi:hypothetical protein